MLLIERATYCSLSKDSALVFFCSEYLRLLTELATYSKLSKLRVKSTSVMYPPLIKYLQQLEHQRCNKSDRYSITFISSIEKIVVKFQAPSWREKRAPISLSVYFCKRRQHKPLSPIIGTMDIESRIRIESKKLDDSNNHDMNVIWDGNDSTVL